MKFHGYTHNVTLTALWARPRYGGPRPCKDCRSRRRSNRRSHTEHCHRSGQPASAARSCNPPPSVSPQTICKIYKNTVLRLNCQNSSNKLQIIWFKKENNVLCWNRVFQRVSCFLITPKLVLYYSEKIYSIFFLFKFFFRWRYLIFYHYLNLKYTMYTHKCTFILVQNYWLDSTWGESMV